MPYVETLGYRVIAPDLPGFGQSDRFQSASTWERYMEFISDFLEALNIQKIHLYVHDWVQPLDLDGLVIIQKAF